MSAPGPIDRALAELRAGLAGVSRRRRNDVLLEVRAHLEDAAAEEEARGIGRVEAERRACVRLGSLSELSAEARAAAGPTWRRLLAGCVLAVAVAVTIAVAVFHMQTRAQPGAAAHRTLVAPVPVTGGTPAERRLVRRVLAGLGRSDVVAVRIGDPMPHRNGWRAGTWLDVTYSARSQRADEPGLWEALLTEGGYRNLAYAAGLPDLTGIALRRRLPGGRVEAWGGGEAGGNRPTAVAVPASRAEVVGRVRAAAQSAGLELRSLAISDPYEPAPMVVLEIAKRDLGRSLRAFEAHMDVRGTAGIYLRIVSPDGHLVYLNTMVDQTGMSTTYADRSWMGSVQWGDPGRFGQGLRPVARTSAF